MKKLKRLFLVLPLAFLLSACSLPGLGGGSGEDGVTVIGQTTTESQILTYIVHDMIEYYSDLDADVIVNMGSTTMANQAMVQNDANIASSMYTGSVIAGVLGMDEIPTDPEEAMTVAREGVAEQLGQQWYPTWGFANTYAFMVRPETAEEYGLETVSDLEAVADELFAGVDQAWISKEGDGYQAFTEHYGFDFSNIFPMDIGLAYGALASGQVDVILGYSTDGRISSYDLQLLEDDQLFFPSYDASPTANFSILESQPAIDDVLLKLEDTITDEQMQQLNFLSDDYLLEPSTVAREFLEANDYFVDKEPLITPAGGED